MKIFCEYYNDYEYNLIIQKVNGYKNPIYKFYSSDKNNWNMLPLSYGKHNEFIVKKAFKENHKFSYNDDVYRMVDHTNMRTGFLQNDLLNILIDRFESFNNKIKNAECGKN